jgi:hypothetical protein
LLLLLFFIFESNSLREKIFERNLQIGLCMVVCDSYYYQVFISLTIGVEVELQTTNNRTLRGVVMGIENKSVKKRI